MVRLSHLFLDWSISCWLNGLHCPASPPLVVGIATNTEVSTEYEWTRHPAPLDCSYFSNIIVNFCGFTDVSVSGVRNRRGPPPLLPLALPRSQITHQFLQSRFPGRFTTRRRAAFPHLQRRTRVLPPGKTERAIFPLPWPVPWPTPP